MHHWIDHVERRDRRSLPNYMSAAGQTRNISENPALFSLIGTNYGGNGTTTFQLPDLTSAAPDSTIYLICVSGVFPVMTREQGCLPARGEGGMSASREF